MYESNRELLSLCYEDLEEIRDGYYTARQEAKYGVIDAGGKTVIPFEYSEIFHIGPKIYAYKRFTYHVFNSSTFEEMLPTEKELSISSIQRFSEHAFIVEQFTGKGIWNDRGEEIIPLQFIKIWVSYQTSTHDFLKTRLMGEGIEARKLGTIKVDKNYTKADCVHAVETAIPDTQLVVTKIKETKKQYGLDDTRYIYGIRHNGKIVADGFHDVMAPTNLAHLGIIQTYMKSKGNVTTGYCKVTGEVLVEPTKYTNINYIGNGITIVKNRSKYGTVKDGVEVVQLGQISNTHQLESVPIMLGLVGDKWKYIGNDGRTYKELYQAFPIYKYKHDSNVNLMCLYGGWVIVDNKLRRIEVKNEYKELGSYVKL